MNFVDIIIVGAGPAGIATAIQLKRYGFELVLFEKNMIGGLLKNANLVENYPGFPDGISGIDLVTSLTTHLEKFVTVCKEEILKIEHDGRNYNVKTNNKELGSKFVVIATGTKPRMFTDIHIPDPIKDRVFYEVYPLINISGKRIAIIGAGDAAFDYALNLSQNNDVLILNRNSKTTCLPLLHDRVLKSSKIKIYNNTQIRKLTEIDEHEFQIVVNNTDSEDIYNIDYLLPAIGREPQLDMLDDNIKDKTVELQETGTLYFVGDVNNGMFRQTAISVGDGIKAAMMIYEKLKGEA